MISFCVPCYNGEAYLRGAVDSILLQQPDDFELIIIDDASVDGTYELACRLAAQDCRIRLHRNRRNIGLVRNWNRCLEEARGEWIKFVFQDDLLSPEYLGRVLEAARSTDAVMAFSERDIRLEAGVAPDIRHWFENDLVRFSDAFPDTERVSAGLFSRKVLEHLGKNFLGEPTSALLHRSCIFRHGVFNPHFAHITDLEYWCRIGCHEGVTYVPEQLATFRVHPHSTTAVSKTTLATSFQRDHLDLVMLYAAYLLEPAFAPLRTALPDACDHLYRKFVDALHTAKRRLQDASISPEAAALQSQWQAMLATTPGINLLEHRDSGWRRAAQHLWSTIARAAA